MGVRSVLDSKSVLQDHSTDINGDLSSGDFDDQDRVLVPRTPYAEAADGSPRRFVRARGHTGRRRGLRPTISLLSPDRHAGSPHGRPARRLEPHEGPIHTWVEGDVPGAPDEYGEGRCLIG